MAPWFWRIVSWWHRWLGDDEDVGGQELVDGGLQAADVHVLVDLLYSKLGVPVYSGVEDMHYVAYVLGARGVISDLATAFPETAATCTRAFAAGNMPMR